MWSEYGQEGDSHLTNITDEPRTTGGGLGNTQTPTGRLQGHGQPVLDGQTQGTEYSRLLSFFPH